MPKKITNFELRDAENGRVIREGDNAMLKKDGVYSVANDDGEWKPFYVIDLDEEDAPAEPEPTPDPTPEPEPAPEPTPEPNPAPTPDPAPAPSPTPAPSPDPNSPADVASIAELKIALAVAMPGSTITLAPGNYGNLSLSGYVFAAPVLIQSVDLTNPAVFDGITINNCTGLRIVGVKSAYTFNGEPEFHTPNFIKDSPDVTFDMCEFVGSMNGTAGFWGVGVRSMNSDRFTITRCEVHRFFRGIYTTGGLNVLVRLNEIHDIRSDGVNPHLADGMLIEGNYIHDFGGVAGNGDHRDMIQIIGSGGAASRGVIIRKNLLYQGSRYAANDSVAQSIWAGGDQRNGQHNHDDVKVIDNYIAQSHINGICLHETDNFVISGNVVSAFPRVDPRWPGAIETPRIAASGSFGGSASNNKVPFLKVPSVLINGADLSNQNGNQVVDVPHDQLLAMAQADPELAHFFGG